MTAEHFNAPDELERVKQKRKLRRKKKYCKSCLEKYRAEIVAMLKEKTSSYRLVEAWLEEQRIYVSHTTVMRYAKKLPELKQKPEAQEPVQAQEEEVPHAELS